MNWYFIACIYMEAGKRRPDYEEYIRLVRPIVEHYGGKYLVRSEEISSPGDQWTPDRMIVIRFPDRMSLEMCFSSREYRQIMDKRISSVDSRAVIVPGVREWEEENEDM